jgi:hypothetical protein
MVKRRCRVNTLKVHRHNVAQLIPLDTPSPRVMPCIQDPLDVLGHPRHDDVEVWQRFVGDWATSS